MRPHFWLYVEFNILEAVVGQNWRNIVSFEAWDQIAGANYAVPLQELFDVLDMLALVFELVHINGDFVLFLARLDAVLLYFGIYRLTFVEDNEHPRRGDVHWNLLILSNCGKSFIL